MLVGLFLSAVLAMTSPPAQAAATSRAAEPVGTPYSRLFQHNLQGAVIAQSLDDVTGSSRHQVRAKAPRSKVVCGMTILMVEPTIDPTLVQPVPPGREFTMRRVRPRVCGADDKEK